MNSERPSQPERSDQDLRPDSNDLPGQEASPKTTGFWNAFANAFRGIRLAFGSERNMKVHLGITVLAVVLSFLLHVSLGGFLFIIMMIGITFAAELFNTAIEKTIDLVSPHYNELAGRIKDISAGAVLVCAIMSVIIAGIVYIQALMALWVVS